MNRQAYRDIAWRVAAECAGAGFDLVHAFSLADYNGGVAEPDRLPDFGRQRALSLLIGNTRALWPVFVDALRTDSALESAEHPLDSYAESRIQAAVSCSTNLPYRCHFSHVIEPRAVPMQRLAERSGFSMVSPSHLSVHPVHGPWIALRAVVVVDCEGPPLPSPPAARPCAGCSAPCMPAFMRAVAAAGPKLDADSVRTHAADWIAARDACPVGRASRYSEAQLRYHYGLEGRGLETGRLRQGS